jgi:hypothetical protein
VRARWLVCRLRGRSTRSCRVSLSEPALETSLFQLRSPSSGDSTVHDSRNLLSSTIPKLASCVECIPTPASKPDLQLQEAHGGTTDVLVSYATSGRRSARPRYSDCHLFLARLFYQADLVETRRRHSHALPRVIDQLPCNRSRLVARKHVLGCFRRWSRVRQTSRGLMAYALVSKSISASTLPPSIEILRK